MPHALTLYAWPTPNAYKVSIMLEECDLEYNVVPIDITAGDQHTDEFKALAPNGKIPVLTDINGPQGRNVTLFESGAILLYLAEKMEKFTSPSPTHRYEVLQWLMWQMAGFGPMLGQAHHFRLYAPEKVEYGIQRYTKEAQRLYGVLEERLSQSTYISNEHYTIADIAIYPWAVLAEKQGVDLSDKPHIQNWLEAIGNRPAVKKGMDLLSEYKRDTAQSFTEEERKHLFAG